MNFGDRRGHMDFLSRVASKSKGYKIAKSAYRIARNGSRSRAYWRERPLNHFTSLGYEIVPGFLSEEECARLRAFADSTVRDHSYFVKGECYTSVRSEAGIGMDLNVAQI